MCKGINFWYPYDHFSDCELQFYRCIRVVCCTLQTNTSHGSIPHIMWSYVQWLGAIECRDTGYMRPHLYGTEMLLRTINIANGSHVIRHLFTELAWDQFKKFWDRIACFIQALWRLMQLSSSWLRNIIYILTSLCLYICVTPPTTLWYLSTVLRSW